MPAYVDSRGQFVGLARTKTGRLFRKQILHFGKFSHPAAPGGTLNVDRMFADTLVKNFNSGVSDIVQIPLAGGKNEHTEDPERNLGEVIGLETDEAGVHAVMDFRRSADAVGQTLLGASAMLNLDYTDTRSRTNTQSKT
jgi:hypothetical protein